MNGIRLSGWLAIFVKHMVNLYYFFGLRSGYAIFQYIMHEFFHTKDRRNIFRFFTEKYGNVLWSFPLRLFVGGFWINEGAAKIWGESVWNKVTSNFDIGQLFRGPGYDSWLVSSQVKMPFTWLQPAMSGASATSGASPAAAAYAEPIISEMPGWFEWIMRVMLPNTEMALFMQKVIPFIELIIGILILVGLFTWLANAASAGFLVVFVLSAMLGWDKVWALPASIALMNGSGRVIGLDYWVVPFLQRTLGKSWYGQERGIYKDK